MQTNTMFQRATKHEARLRLAITGPSGAGKTYTSLLLASFIGKRVAVIDTERGSASKYADKFEFDVLNLTDCNPASYVRAIRAAADAGYDVCVIDSLSHAWNGRGGALELVDEASRRSKSNNSFGAWREVTPLHNSLVDEIVGSSMHVIATMRTKTEWAQERDDRGKTQIRKVGMAPIQRDGIEYEFDIVFDMDQDNTAVVTKTRCSTLSGQVMSKPGHEVAVKLLDWLQGKPLPAAPITPVVQRESDPVIDNPMMDSPALVSLLDAIKHARSAMALKTIATLAAKLPPAEKQIARQAYAARQEQLATAANDPRLAKIEEALADEHINQQLVDYMGTQGCALEPHALDSLSDKELKLAVAWIDEATKQP